MKATTKKYAANGLAVGIAAAMLQFATPAAAFSVDGIVTGADAYTSTFDLDFLVENIGGRGTNATRTGQLRLGRDGAAGNIFMHLTVPISVVDNVYGPDAFVLTTDWAPVKHEFAKLVGSDGFEFNIATTGGSKFVKVEYAKNDGNPNIKNNDGTVLLDVATSLELNLANGFGDNVATGGANPQSPDPAAPPAGWEQAIQYEFEFDGMLFAPGAIGPSALANGILHASPNKLDGDNKVLIPCLGIAAGQTGACEPTTPPPTAMSEPASGALFLAGLGLLSLYRRRQARN